MVAARVRKSVFLYARPPVQVAKDFGVFLVAPLRVAAPEVSIGVFSGNR